MIWRIKPDASCPKVDELSAAGVIIRERTPSIFYAVIPFSRQEALLHVTTFKTSCTP